MNFQVAGQRRMDDDKIKNIMVHEVIYFPHLIQNVGKFAPSVSFHKLILGRYPLGIVCG